MHCKPTLLDMVYFYSYIIHDMRSVCDVLAGCRAALWLVLTRACMRAYGLRWESCREAVRQVCDGVSFGRCDTLPSHTDNNTQVGWSYTWKHTWALVCFQISRLDFISQLSHVSHIDICVDKLRDKRELSWFYRRYRQVLVVKGRLRAAVDWSSLSLCLCGYGPWYKEDSVLREFINANLVRNAHTHSALQHKCRWIQLIWRFYLLWCGQPQHNQWIQYDS